MTDASAPDLANPVPTGTARSWASRSVTFGGLLVGGLVAVVASAQPWWRAAGTDALVAFSGADTTGGLSQALAVVTLAGTLLVLVLKAGGRRILAVLLAAAGLGLAVVGMLRRQPTSEAVRTRIREVSLVDQYALTSTPWPWVAAFAGVLVVLGATALFVGAPTWTTTRSRFERDAPRPPDLVAADDPAVLWKAMDAGLDPTDGGEVDTPGPAAPNVHYGHTGDTMVAKPADRSAQPPE